jgi:hypothetical protein
MPATLRPRVRTLQSGSSHDGATQESNLPSVGLRRRTGFEDRCGIRRDAAQQKRSRRAASEVARVTIVRLVTGDELRLLEARWRVREISESDLHGLADELLAKGEDDEALIHLFSLDRDELRWTGADAFESLLRAWGGGMISEAEAVDIVLRHIAAGVLAGTITPLEATSRADAINVRFDYRHDALREWCDLHEELGYLDRSGRSYLGRDQPAIEADVMVLARSVVGGPS